MNFCVKCGQKLTEKAKFCSSCGVQISNATVEKEPKKYSGNNSNAKQASMKEANALEIINKQIELQNSESGIVKKAWFAAGFFALMIVIAFSDVDALPIHPAAAMISLFFLILSVIVAVMFRSREKKLHSLITGENLLAYWTLNEAQKEAYTNFLFEHEKGKNAAILGAISVISILIFGVFILVIDEGKLAMFLVLVGLLFFLTLFAFGMPRYYKYQNSKNDGRVLIGAKFAYINGYFHNWDFVLSGLSKIKIIDTPFYGINLVYYYTDRTFRHSEELFIPANENQNLPALVSQLMQHN